MAGREDEHRPAGLEQIPADLKETSKMTQYLVSACGVSVICNGKEDVVRWMKEFVQRGGTPSVKEVESEERQRA